jgi:hypothetical protein
MKTRLLLAAILVVLSCIFITRLSAQDVSESLSLFQDTTSNVSIRFKSGTTYIGKLRYNVHDTIAILTTDLGLIKIPYSKINRIDYITIRKGKAWFPQPLPGRYFFSPSAFTLRPGEGYYQNTMIAVNSFNVGVTNWFSIGGGIEFFTTIASITVGDFSPTFFITPKVGFKVAPNLRIGTGVLYLQLLGNEVNFANFYGVVTYGNEDNNITGGIGWGYSKIKVVDDGAWMKKPLVTLSGTARMSRKLAFISENWFVPEADETGITYYPFFSYGLRFMGESISVDLLFLNNEDIIRAFFLGIPLVSFTVKF